ncbi:unnamed protein product (macronuclear) [Paramecium tetraurelia]|uniref:F-BAR domain-containing protein n=1 Tax=Paramecium tetraurelia TaxID=5888 RepID=A0CJY1_PARTE|nr:uncharacterized protein GSPATT00000810001 [Paramecium tetraurelia]CAK71098.1 unnamed protein product [Paramecium tetraurelia]|eukprot:XP_001438495.1 hypothetical protein (macronuclear) [Paramecium tetraurelia strain d4-2]
MSIKQLATNFDVLYRRVSDRSKVTEILLGQLFERSEAEEKYHKALEKISGQMQNSGGDIDDLLKGMKINLNQRAQYYKQFNQSYKHDVELAINDLKQIQCQFKPLIQEVLKTDKDIKVAFDKYDRQKDKTFRASKDYEEAAITLEAQCWNKECNPESRSKAQIRLNQQLVYKQENESALRHAATTYNNFVQSYNTLLQNGIQQLISYHNQIFSISKDILMKILVYEISKTRNLQYDSEQFFKEAEKYLDPQDDPIAPGPSSQIGITKDNYLKVTSQQNSSFLKTIADQISLSHRLNVNRETVSLQQLEVEDEFDLFLANQQFIDDLKEVSINLINKVSKKNKSKNNEEKQLAGVQAMVNKYKNQYGEQQLIKIFSYIKHIIQSTQEQQIKGWKNIPQIENNVLEDELESKFFRELGCIILESFRQAGRSQLSQFGFKNIITFTQKLLEISQREGELILVKRLITMISTIYTIDDKEKRFFLQDSLISMSIWKQIDLWEGVIYTTIEAEIDKSATKDSAQFTKEQIFKDKNVIYSNLLSLTLNMVNFKIDKQEIKNVLNKYARAFQLFELQTQELLKFAENDGKIEPNSKVNSLSILQSLYYQPQTTSTIQGPLGQKKVVIFDKKNPLSSNLTVQKPGGNQVYFSQDTPTRETISPQISPYQNNSSWQQQQQQHQQEQLQQQEQQQQQQQQQQQPQQQYTTIQTQSQQQSILQKVFTPQNANNQSLTILQNQQNMTIPQQQANQVQQIQETEQTKIRYSSHPLEVPRPNNQKKQG